MRQKSAHLLLDVPQRCELARTAVALSRRRRQMARALLLAQVISCSDAAAAAAVCG